MSPDDEWIEHMRRGDFAAAWSVSDALLAARPPASLARLPRHLRPVWDGTPLAGRRVLVRCHHGLGDTLQFARFVPPLRERAAEVTVLAQPELLPLLRRVRGLGRLLPLDAGEDPPHDVDVEIMELPHALRLRPQDLPAGAARLALAARHLGAAAVHATAGGDSTDGERRTRVRLHAGIVWRAGEWNPVRSVDPRALRPLAAVPGVAWHVLQRGPAAAHWPREFGSVPCIHDLADEARALRGLDLLVTVDTFSAHLAGALGVRTWLLLTHDADWRWMRDREDSPWYPTLRLWRQREPGAWAEVVARVASNLREIVE